MEGTVSEALASHVPYLLGKEIKLLSFLQNSVSTFLLGIDAQRASILATSGVHLLVHSPVL